MDHDRLMQRTKTLRQPCALLLVFGCVVSGSASAELPPWAYKERQEKAPEALVIKVQAVTTRKITEEEREVVEFTVKAEVRKVERTATKLVPGATIEISYTQHHYSKPIVGPSEVPALKEGEVCPAYLAREGNTYSPAAGGFSFRTVP
jgi:hypothetical protein